MCSQQPVATWLFVLYYQDFISISRVPTSIIHKWMLTWNPHSVSLSSSSWLSVPCSNSVSCRVNGKSCQWKDPLIYTAKLFCLPTQSQLSAAVTENWYQYSSRSGRGDNASSRDEKFEQGRHNLLIFPDCLTSAGCKINNTSTNEHFQWQFVRFYLLLILYFLEYRTNECFNIMENQKKCPFTAKIKAQMGEYLSFLLKSS